MISPEQSGDIKKNYCGHKIELFLDNLGNQELDNLRDHKHPSLRPDSVAIPLFHSAEGQRYLSPQYYLLFATYHMYDRLFIYVKHTNSYVPSRIPVPTIAKNE